MGNLFNLIIKIIDFFYQKKIITFFKNNSNSRYDVLMDVGAHKGETIFNFLKNFKIKNIYSFEASKNTYQALETNTNRENAALTAANLYLNGFTISQEGTIDIPNVGEVLVLNQTLEEAEATISLKAKELLI